MTDEILMRLPAEKPRH